MKRWIGFVLLGLGVIALAVSIALAMFGIVGAWPIVLSTVIMFIGGMLASSGKDSDKNDGGASITIIRHHDDFGPV